MAEPIDAAALFDSGSESEDEADQQQQQLDNKKQRLEALASKKRKEAEEEQEAREQKRSRRSEVLEDVHEGVDGGAEGEELGEPAGRKAAPVQADENVEVVENADDRAFIDDEGVPEDENAPWAGGSDDEHEEGRAPPEEAEEAEEGEMDDIERALTSKGRRRKKVDEAHLSEFIEDFLSRMDAAKEVDNENNAHGQPALEKVKLLPEVEDVLSRTVMHKQFLDAGLMGAIRDWLYPLPDGSLPNIRLRTAMLRLLERLPIDTSQEHRKEQLKRSKLGEIVMFYYKLADETQANRKTSKILIERWSKPIFDSYKHDMIDESRDAERSRMESARRERMARQRDAERQDAEEAEAKAGLKPGDTGFRWHARVPQASHLDYVRKPEVPQGLQAAAAAAAQGGGGGRKGGGSGSAARLTKKLKELGGKGKKVGGRAANVSVEGRGI